ncbi:CRISPR system precrRNA processing endoribonuclease RAMP protein Cas6 [Thioalkalivibrio paradoxus]|uniref:CRISPR-associated protein Cas6 C-terminal domain-containing protein n=1 Tax=Thioalkalivibrio paradoxus ARh 1 TaxID=713585 RepID=W0DIZ6_9GAMM|nr:CRISPR system precrRNA processing endoribonuclease RAMP protein Cas6 [Thioalkalivibrio paradoxus]AHE98421.1 hypothetical protein THITH_09255 [Thioalkalivibrio paradoxus ARh 1]
MTPSAEPHLPLARYRLHFRAGGEVRLPYFAGSTWRGALGHALKRLVCVTQLPRCAACALVHVCAHAYLFETPPPQNAEKMRKYPSVPHPFVLNPAVGVERVGLGESYVLDLTLIGHGNRHLPYLLHAFERAGLAGIGKGRTRMELEGAEREVRPGADTWQRVYEPGQPVELLPVDALPIPPSTGDRLRVELRTPLRLRREGRPVRPDTFRFSDLFSSLLRRVSMLTYFHADHPLETDFAGLTTAARAVPLLDSQLTWRSWNRFSSRQKTEVAMDGLLGTIELPTERIAPFWPYLWLGQFVHAGAGTSMGQGRLQRIPS